MLPILVSRQLLEGLQEFLRATFPVTTSGFLREDGRSFVEDFLRTEGALAKGPWLEVKLPFRRSEGAELPFSRIALNFAPWQHQLRAFERLVGTQPRSTIVATGTGSGKTECFMYPLLDHCLTHRGKGIKAIVIYPMNALATDQARRFAKECQELNPKLSVGLYTGDDGTENRAMMPDQVITHRATLRENPPDILLTNYKMLDFLMLRPADQKLWRFNLAGTLKYLVVDELHTFDGAQGTDLACLVRRLRDKLKAGPELACVGTSATIGGAQAVADLRAYAQQVFATPFDEDAIVLEDRMTVDEYLDATAGGQEAIARWPTNALEVLRPPDGGERTYLRRVAQVWTSQDFALDAEDEGARLRAAVELGSVLPRLTALQELLREAHALCDVGALARAWQQRLRLSSQRDAELLIDSLCAMVSAARTLNTGGPAATGDLTADDVGPFLQVRVQLWLRELRRMVAKVGPVPELTHADELLNLANPLHLPVLHCRECHSVSWGAVWPAGEPKLKHDLQLFYQSWFNQKPDSRLIYPAAARPAVAPETELRWLCLSCLKLSPMRSGDTTCTECAGQQLAVWMPEIRKKVERRESVTTEVSADCPVCAGHESLAVLGSRAASIASVLIGDLFGSAYNNDYKLIAFSDSVQDAAHRAGFFGARTYNQVLRHALADFIRQQGEGFPLSRVADEFPRYWLDRCGSAAAFVGTFIAPNMDWLHGYRELREQGAIPPGSDVVSLVTRRLRWEVLVEFGLRSRIGRTLERTGAASVALDEPALRSTAARLATRLREELGGLRDARDSAVELFLLGLMTRARQMGAFYDGVLESYVREGGNEYQLTRLPFMPGYGLRHRPPAMLSLQKVSSNFETLLGKDHWYLQWFNKCLAVAQPLATAEYEQAYTLTLEVLERDGWLIALQSRQQTAWGLNPARWTVATQARDLACDICQHRLPVPIQQDNLAVGLPCLRKGCRGHYRMAPLRIRASTYKAQPHRLVSSEHTALLDGQTRHRIEQSFIHGHETWDINLLSATPTLEMGIDIGSLSTVLLCSVPPAQANYLQRIGRAGRRDGNALALTIAGGHRHDLYFYAAPLEMLAGQVTTPGVFLKAMAVLERQLLAFCFDRWVSTSVNASALPGLLREVLDAVESGRVDGFPLNLLGFVDTHEQSLLADFCAMFDDLDDDGIAHLKRFVSGGQQEGSLGWRVLNRLNELAQTRKGLKERIEELKKRIRQLEVQPEDELRNQHLYGCRDERTALIELISNINRRQTLNFFTDEGLLPNYAFPEEGVTLNSVILRRRETTDSGDERRRYDALSLTFQRSAQAALGELVPEARFYAAEHQLHIDQVDLKLSKPQSWRLCPACHYSENLDESGDPHAVCPRCGSAMWADADQRRTMLKLRQVYARADSRRDRIGDDSDQRQPAFYRRQLLIDIPAETQMGGFRLDSEELPFGFEYLRNARFREINFGELGDASDAFNVAGRQEARKGFPICLHCGTVRRKRLRRGQFAHALDCPLARQGAVEQETDWIDSLYLYRELNSEAVRILLPLADVAESDVTRHSFVAALNMGLKRFFRGNVQHLEISDMQEPPVGGHSPKQYLVIYDRIPGGTGYLKELMRSPDILLGLLQQAHDHLAGCECVDDIKRDGCYRCILAYRDSRNMDAISRKAAQALLKKVLDLRHLLKPVERLSDIHVNSMLGSHLEARFVGALSAQALVAVTKRTVNGKPGYWIGPSDPESNSPMWELEPQVKLGIAQGVAVQTVPDFVLRPVREVDRQAFGEWALYLDGFGPHHAIQTDDTRKRMAVLGSGRRVWTLTWRDLPQAGTKPESVNTGYLTSFRSPQWLQAYDLLAERFSWPDTATLDELVQLGSFMVLVHLITQPARTLAQLRQLPLANAIAWLHKPSLDAAMLQAPEIGVQAVLPSAVWKALKSREGHLAIGGLLPGIGRDTAPVKVLTIMPKAALTSRECLETEVGCHLCLDDGAVAQTKEFEHVWRGFWYAANLLQLAPEFTVTTASGVGIHAYESALERWSTQDKSAEAPPLESVDAAWGRVFKECVIDRFALERLAAAKLTVPEVGLDLKQGIEVVGTAELAWIEGRVAVVISVEPSLKVNGWSLIFASEDRWIEKVIALLAGRNGNE
ncbi:MAG: DEAD/DEAH box helicase [Betaproteobacteria bacterium]|nr:MAG: DEAD/DEAH box helicase [Betaproteobacteria bacterium]